MIKHLMIAAAFGVATAGTAFAADAPKDPQDCMKQAFELAKSAQSKKLSEAKLGEVEELLTKMEDQCDAGDMAKAAEAKAELSKALGN
ncbi:MAG: hypothetical protein K0U74_14215 [Alphaproteobacteria bacterium]|nr:hypothetical protein [Alphaproteobacteria bacterium]